MRISLQLTRRTKTRLSVRNEFTWSTGAKGCTHVRFGVLGAGVHQDPRHASCRGDLLGPTGHQESQSLGWHPCVMVEELCRGDSRAESGLEG